MSLQSNENWWLYLAIKDIRNVEALKMYRCVSKLNESISKQAKIDIEKTNEEDLINTF